MKFGSFEVDLVDSNFKKVFHERRIGDQNYFVGLPGKEYGVRVTLNRDESSKKYSSKRFKIGVYVDGLDANYWKRIDTTNISDDSQEEIYTVFWGFKKSNEEMRAFVFASPNSPTNAGDNVHTTKQTERLGQIKIVVFEAVLGSGIFNNQSGCYDLSSESSISEDKKFWQQASVTTKPGRKLEEYKEIFAPIPRWQNVSKDPIIEMIVQYHTKETLDALEALVGGGVAELNNLIHNHNSQIPTSSTNDKKTLKRPLEDNLNNSKVGEKKQVKIENKSGKKEDGQHGNDDEEVVIVPVVRSVPFMDLSDENPSEQPIWSSIELKR